MLYCGECALALCLLLSLQGAHLPLTGTATNDLHEIQLCLNILHSLCALGRPLPWLLRTVKIGVDGLGPGLHTWRGGEGG